MNVISPIYHDNIIHVDDAIHTGESFTEAVAIQVDEHETIAVFNNNNITFGRCRDNCFGLAIISILCFAFFIIMGGVGLFV